MTIVLKGRGGGSSGSIVGAVGVLGNMQDGDVLVAHETSPNHITDMHRAGAVVTDIGGPVSHAAVVCTGMGIPFVVGTGNATELLKAGMFVEVNPVDGTVTVLEN